MKRRWMPCFASHLAEEFSLLAKVGIQSGRQYDHLVMTRIVDRRPADISTDV